VLRCFMKSSQSMRGISVKNAKNAIVALGMLSLTSVMPHIVCADVTLSNHDNHSTKNASHEFAANNPFSARAGMTEFDQLIPSNINVKLTDDLSPDDVEQSKIWGISYEDEKTYLALMKGKMGTYYADKHLSPVEILGMAANSDAKRMEYAKLYAKQDMQKAAREIAWNNEAYVAKRQIIEARQLPLIRKFDYAPFSPFNQKPVVLQKGDRFNLFVKPEDEVTPVVNYLLRSLSEHADFVVQIYVKGATDAQLQNWGLSHNIPAAYVNNGLISLNNQGVAMSTVKTLPSAYVSRTVKDKSFSVPVDLGLF
jgi:integrating conjugative element protein (TIGR03759 family)